MSKITLSSILNNYFSTTKINSNFATIQTAIDNTISRDGTGPNQMLAPFDMNGYQIINLPAPTSDNSPVRLQDVASNISILQALAGTGTVGSYSTVGNGSTLTLTETPASAWHMQLYRDGVAQKPGIDYTVSGTTLTVTVPYTIGEDFWWIHNGSSILPSTATVNSVLGYTGTVTQVAAKDLSNVVATSLSLGSLSFSDVGLTYVTGQSSSTYIQEIIQNLSAAVGASADFVVANNLGTATTYYGDFGINSSAFTGTGSFSLPNATYLYSVSGDLVLGTFTANGIHFVVNNGATDSASVSSTGQWTFNQPIITTVYTVGTLPAAASNTYARTFVSDSSVAASGNFGAVVAGSGTNKVPVYSDGTNWRIG